MARQAARQRIKFRDVAMGQRFRDLVREEYFVKQGNSMAAMVNAIGDGTVPDAFLSDVVVGPKE
jgi:hypothetical protein